MNRNRVDIIKLFYGATVFSILLFIVGLIIDFTTNSFLNNQYFDWITMQLPFIMWACLIIVGILFIRKNWMVAMLCLLMAIPHVVAIAIMLADSYSAIDILKWYFIISRPL
jgi:hypothetical protein